MNIPRVITKDEFMTAFDTHNHTLLRFLADFTQDQEKARKIMEEALWEWLNTPAYAHVTRFIQLLSITRKKAIEALYDMPSNPSIERTFFCFSDRVTVEEKEIFYLLYFRGFSRERAALIWNLSMEQITAIQMKVMLDIRGCIYDYAICKKSFSTTDKKRRG